MPNINFYLDKQGKNPKKLIYLYLRYSGKTFKYSTKERIHESLWNKDKQQARASKLFPLYEAFNRKLSKLESIAAEVYYQLFNSLGREPEPKEIRVLMDEKLNRSKKEKDIVLSFLEFYKKYIKDNEAIKVSNPHNTTLNLLSKFEEEASKVYKIEEVDVDYYYGFTAFCIKGRYSNSTTNRHVKRIKEVLRYAEDIGLKVNSAYKMRKFKKLKEVASTVVFLTSSEIDALFNYDFSYNKRLEKVRDIFMIGCCTGLRYSDLKRFTEIFIIEKSNISLVTTTTTKGLAPVTIPCHHYLKNILKKYPKSTPPIISSQNSNKYIKEVCKIVGIKGQIEDLKMIGTELVRTPVERNNEISYHNARHSFARNAYLSGISIENIRILIGHTNIKQTREYIRITELENAMGLSNHHFFTGIKK